MSYVRSHDEINNSCERWTHKWKYAIKINFDITFKTAKTHQTTHYYKKCFSFYGSHIYFHFISICTALQYFELILIWEKFTMNSMLRHWLSDTFSMPTYSTTYTMKRDFTIEQNTFDLHIFFVTFVTFNVGSLDLFGRQTKSIISREQWPIFFSVWSYLAAVKYVENFIKRDKNIWCTLKEIKT